MAGPASIKASIQFGPLLQIPVAARGAVKEEKFAFNMHHAADGGRLRQGALVCEFCGADVPKSEVVKGFEGKPGIDEDYLSSLALEKSPIIALDGLVDASQIDPRYYQKSYTLVPEAGGAKGYVLILRLLERSSKVGIGKVITSGKEHIVTIRPRGGVLAMELMYWPSELVSDSAAREAIAGVEVTDAELQMGDQLVGYLSKPFEPETYVNGYAAAVREYLEQFLAGATPAKLEPRTVAAAPTQDLAAALALSLNALGGVPAKKGAKKATRKASAA